MNKHLFHNSQRALGYRLIPQSLSSCNRTTSVRRLAGTAQTNFKRNIPVLSCRSLSSITHGQDLLEDSLNFGSKRKIILDSYYPNAGIDVLGMLKYDGPEEDDQSPKTDSLLMNGSVIAFPHMCYLWKPQHVNDVTLESLSMIILSTSPPLDLLLIGADEPLPQKEMRRIQDAMQKKHVVVEQMDVMNAMGSFNILNGEDRNIAVALVLNVKNEE